MGKKMLSFLLTLVMLFTVVPAKVSAKTPAAGAADGTAAKEAPCKGGLQAPEEIEISQEEAERIGTVGIEDLTADKGGRINGLEYGSQRYDTVWDEYASHYIYNRLNTKQRRFWDLLDTVSRNYLHSGQNAERTRTSGGAYNTMKGVQYLSLGLNKQEAVSISLMFKYANPQYYFLDSTFVYGGGSLFLGIYDQFANGEVRRQETEKMQAQINVMKAQVETGATELEKAKIAHDLIIRKVKYDPKYLEDPEHPATPFHQSAYSVFCDSYTVCAGYTKAFALLMCAVGMDAVSVTSPGHAWNIVCLNSAWYYVDCTWDDMDGANGLECIYTYFGLSKETLDRMDLSQYHKEEDFYKGFLPACTLDLGSTQTQVGVVQDVVLSVQAPSIKQKQTKDGMQVTLTTATAGADIYYTTDGSVPSASHSRSFHYSKPFTVDDDVTVKAVAVCNAYKDSEVVSAEVSGWQCTVSFDTRGGSGISSQKVWPQETAAKPADPKRQGYLFAGWYMDSGCTKKWNANKKVTEDMEIYAKWTKVKVAKASVKKLKSSSRRKMDVTVGKVGGAKGYQIRYSTKSNMKSAKKVLANTAKKTISGLKAGKRYYVQARAYKLDSANKKVYGKWSATRKVTIQK